jgi:hypothetical protein
MPSQSCQICLGDAPWSIQMTIIFIFFGLPLEGIELNLELTDSQSVQMKLEDYTWGLPAISGKAITPRPADLMPAPGHPDYTIVRKQVTIHI